MAAETKSPRETKQIAVPVEAWQCARRMAGIRKAQGADDADIGTVIAEAVQESWGRLPQEVRDFLEQPSEESEARAA